MIPVVYTMGKVASSSVYLAISAADLPVFHIHTLRGDRLRQMAQEWLGRGEFPPPHVSVSMAFRDSIFLDPEQCLYISLVRDPIARNLSAFFQILRYQKPEIRNCTDPDELFRHFIDTYPHNIPHGWFDWEFNEMLGIDVYADEFDTESRFTWNPEKRTVIFRTDCADEVKSRVLSDIIGRDILVRRSNDGGKKDYSRLYNGAKESAHYTSDFIRNAFSSRFACHFWTVQEREAMIDKWAGADQPE